MFSFRRNNKDLQEVELTVSNRTVIRVLVLIILAFLFLGALKAASHALTLIFTALFLTLALNAPVHWIARHLPGKLRGNRTGATAVSTLMVLIVLGAFIASIVPPLARQTQSLITAAPRIVQETRDQNNSLGKFIRRYKLEGQVTKLSHQLSERLQNASGTAVTAVTKVGSSIFSVLTILVLTFMMLIEGPRWIAFTREVLSDRHRAYADRIFPDMYRVIKGYVNGQVTLAALAAALITPMLFILHIGYPVALILVIFICGLIPMVGHTIGAIIVTIVALFHSPISALVILAYYILYQQIENYAIQPRIQANSTEMSPLIVFMSVLLGVSFGGLLGGLVAIPIAGCIRIVILDYLRAKHVLGAHQSELTAGTK